MQIGWSHESGYGKTSNMIYIRKVEKRDVETDNLPKKLPILSLQTNKIVLNSYKKNSNKTIFYLVYSPSEQCAHNELELELESKLDVSGFEAAACNDGFKIDFPASWPH